MGSCLRFQGTLSITLYNGFLDLKHFILKQDSFNQDWGNTF